MNYAQSNQGPPLNNLLISSGNDLNKQQVFDELKQYSSGPARYRPFRGKRSVWYPYEPKDRYESFENAGLVILTNSKGTKQRKYSKYSFTFLPR